MNVRLKRRSRKYRDLTFGQSYPVIGIEGDDYRIINDLGQPYLYPPGLFVTVEKSLPANWVVEYGEDGERYAYPPQIRRPGFFEDYHDGDVRAMSTFWRLVNGRLSKTG